MCRNRLDYLCSAIESIISQRPSEFIVSDNSTDDNVARFLIKSYPEIVYVRQSGCLTFYEHLGAALKLGTAPWIFPMHDDDYLLPSFSENIVGYLSPKYSAIAVNGYIAYEKGVSRKSIMGVVGRCGASIIDDPKVLYNRYIDYFQNIAPFGGYIYRRVTAPTVSCDQHNLGIHGDVSLVCQMAEKGTLAWIWAPSLMVRWHDASESSRLNVADYKKLLSYGYNRNYIEKRQRIVKLFRLRRYLSLFRRRNSIVVIMKRRPRHLISYLMLLLQHLIVRKLAIEEHSF